MPKTISYVGTQNRWPELSITGRQSVWSRGQQDQRSDLEAAQLLATGLFRDVDATILDKPERVPFSAVASGAGILWANRQSAAAAGNGAMQWFSDLGASGALMRSDGVNWYPVNGCVVLKNETGTLAAPVSSFPGAGLPHYDPNPVKLPGGLAIRGKSLLVCHLELAQTGAAGGASNNVLIGNLGSVSDPVAADLNYTDTGQTSFYDLSVNFDSNGFRVHRNAPYNGVVGSSTGYVFASGANVDNDLWLGTGSYSLATGQNRLVLQRRWTLFQ